MAFLVVKAVDLCRTRWRTLVVAICVIGVTASASCARASAWEATTLPASLLSCLLGIPAQRIALVACADRCQPIPWQLDERGVDGDLIFEGGELASADEPAGVLDANDEIVFMTADAGRVARDGELPLAACRLAIHVRHPTDGDTWVYALAYPTDAPRSPTSYVQYDVERDTLTGHAVVLGFRDRIPQVLAVPMSPGSPPVNLLDRLKVRASARFLGLIPVSRNEDDLDAPAIGWHVGPVRVVRRQTQRIRVGWGIKSPRFRIDTYFYRNWAAIPVAFRLNFPPTYFFGAITVESVLDFRDLRGWGVLAPSLTSPLEMGTLPPPAIDALNHAPGEWFALLGPQVQLVQFLDVSDSLASLERRLVYRESERAHAPEGVVGEMPGIGYALRGWGAVGSGAHGFAATTYVLPLDEDIGRFSSRRRMRAEVDVVPLSPEAP